ncbi:PASTA domain-containing protein [Nonomuraea sp. SYSU D8015]|uniref:PASTA domain-containing protein n=1 Tax=Nonomuraea sp. SYSU D8015 TaxID=2593644 RepID=UPI00166007DE|nr:PASTA domain-containing protein [Nonomuraea sp. SYSU D8015]
MKIEDQLADAMAEHVAGAEIPPDLGRAVRRRHRTRVLRLRMAGAALVTAAVAVAVPVALGPALPAGGGDAAGRQSSAVVTDDVIVPNVVGMTVAEATRILRESALRAVMYEGGMELVEPEGDLARSVVTMQEPAAGQQIAAGTVVRLDPGLTPSPDPQALGDLGDGREFGGIRLGYLPDGLVWGKWSADKVIGPGKSYTTSFDEPGTMQGGYDVQVFVAHGESAPQLLATMPGKGATVVDVGGRKAKLAYLYRDDEIVPIGSDSGTPTIVWEPRDGLAVQIRMERHYAQKVDAVAELKKIAEGIRATR